MKLSYNPTETDTIIVNATKALLLEHINDFRKIRINTSDELTYSSLFDNDEISKNNIIFDFEMIKNTKTISEPYEQDIENNTLATLLFQRKFPKHDDFFLIDIENYYFNTLTNKERRGLVNRLIRCIDLSYILVTADITVLSKEPILRDNTDIDIDQISNLFDLTETEVTHLQLLSIIGTSKEIGNAFDLSSRTIEKMTSNLCRKLNILNKLDLQLFAKFITSYIDIPYEHIPHSNIPTRKCNINNYVVKFPDEKI